ncbi:MAG: glycerol-3-phosphate 1-O-acyltransferase PlsY [Phycisphaerales bacterium]
MPPWPLFIAIAFLAGSIPFGFLIGKLHGVDLRTVGSKNIGATNLGRTLGKRFFFLCFLLDMLKGMIPTAVAGWQMGVLGEFSPPASDAWWWMGVMAAAVFGHMFTPWLGFKGGKGVATGLGAMLGLFPAFTVPGVGSFVVFMIVLGLWRYVSAASVAGAASLPIWTWYAHQQQKTLRERQFASEPLNQEMRADEIDALIPFNGWPFVAVATLLGGLVIYKHRGNLARLAAGTEPKIGSPKDADAQISASSGQNAPSDDAAPSDNQPGASGADNDESPHQS